MCMELASSASIFCKTAGVRHMMWRLFLLAFKGRVGLVMKDHYTYTNMRLVNSSFWMTLTLHLRPTSRPRTSIKTTAKSILSECERQSRKAGRITEPTNSLSRVWWADILMNERTSLTVWSAQHGVSGAWYLVLSGCVFFLSSFSTTFSFHFVFYLFFWYL
jgi:hypothetical protein